MNGCSFSVPLAAMTEQDTPRQLDALVVGYGPVGATAACLLGRYGVETLVIDRAADIVMSPRAIALDHEALRILQLAGLAENSFPTVAIPEVRMVSPYVGCFARIDTAGRRDGHPQLVTFYQPDLERALRAQVESSACVRVELQTKLVDFRETCEGVTATLERSDGTRREVSARYLVAADGSGSSVRRAIGQDFRGRSYTEDWLVVDAKNATTPIDHVEFLCDPRRPTPHMVAPGGRQRWEFMLKPGESAEDMERMDNVHALLARWGGAEQLEIERRSVYRFHARCCESFQKGRAFLVGDAAHITPPFIGQGLVAGLRDVANLCWKLAWVTRGHASPALLATYDEERRPHAKQMISLAVWMGRLVMPSSSLQALITHGAMRLLRMVRPLRTFMEQNDMKPPNRFRSGLIVKGRRRGQLIRGGLLPQGLVRDARGAIAPSDDVLGTAFSCIGFGVAPDARVSDATRAAFLHRGGQFVQLHAQRAVAGSDGQQVYEDITGALMRSAPADWIAVVRPDRALMHHGPARDTERILGEIMALLDAERATLQ
jgi:3-(3-hydroxy-phenyl)propionate hydroxylase